MKTLNLLIEEYKELTLKLISEVEEIDQLQKLLDERQKILDEIEILNVDKKVFTVIAKKLKLIELEEELNNKLETQKIKVKEELTNSRRQRQARRSYATKEGNSNFFDKIT